MAPTVHCVRHAEGWHNLSDENMETTHDASLTPMGREQAIRLSEKFPDMDKIDMAVTSPLRRTIQTTFFGFNDHLESAGLKLKLLPQAQETSSKKADTGTMVWKLQREFGRNRIDPAMVESEKEWRSNEGDWATDSDSIHDKARQVREWMKKQKCENLLLVTHGGFLHYLTETLDEAPDGEGSTAWENTEYRSFTFTDAKEAHMEETKESKERRKEKPFSGTDAKGYN